MFYISGRTRSPEGVIRIDNDADLRRSSINSLGGESNVSSLLQVPGLSDSTEKLRAQKDDNLNITYSPRFNGSYSSLSPRSAGLPSGSPTFQKVLLEILSESQNTEDSVEKTLTVPAQTKETGQSKHRQGRRRSSISPAAHIRRKSIFS